MLFIGTQFSITAFNCCLLGIQRHSKEATDLFAGFNLGFSLGFSMSFKRSSAQGSKAGLNPEPSTVNPLPKPLILNFLPLFPALLATDNLSLSLSLSLSLARSLARSHAQAATMTQEREVARLVREINDRDHQVLNPKPKLLSSKA